MATEDSYCRKGLGEGIMQDMEGEEDYSEIETTEAEFDAMWAEATPVPTLVRYTDRPHTEAVTARIQVTTTWAPRGHDDTSTTETAYARRAG